MNIEIINIDDVIIRFMTGPESLTINRKLEVYQMLDILRHSGEPAVDELKAEARLYIRKIPNMRLRRYMFERYICDKTWSKIGGKPARKRVRKYIKSIEERKWRGG